VFRQAENRDVRSRAGNLSEMALDDSESECASKWVPSVIETGTPSFHAYQRTQRVPPLAKY